MTPDELRALADALEPMSSAPRFEGMNVLAFCKWLRAQADAQGAPAVPAGWRLVPAEPTEEWLEVGRKAIEDALVEWRDERLSELNRANGCVIRERDGTPSNVIRFGPETALRIGYKAMLAAAPASPQAEPIDLDAVAMQQMRQAAAESTWMPSEYTSNDWIADVCRWLRDGPPAAAPQAEPKREPLSDEQIDTALQTYPATLLALMGGEMTVGEFKSALRRLARTVEHAHGISGGGHD